MYELWYLLKVDFIKVASEGLAKFGYQKDFIHSRSCKS
jgi:hypothetical protein